MTNQTIHPICGTCNQPKRKTGLGYRCDNCALPAPPDFSDAAVARFWSKVNKSPGQGPSRDCWEWTAGCDRDGYGQFGGKRWGLRAHRYSWLLHHPGESLTPKDHVAHHCDNPPCVKPDHHFKTDLDGNNKDKARKGRSARFPGELSPNAKITESDVRAIRARYASGGISQSALGAEYGISQCHVGDIVRLERWKHLA